MRQREPPDFFDFRRRQRLPAPFLRFRPSPGFSFCRLTPMTEAPAATPPRDCHFRCRQRMPLYAGAQRYGASAAATFYVAPPFRFAD